MTTTAQSWSFQENIAATDTPMLLFRLGGELFAVELGAAEEVLEFPELEELTGMPAAALGVFTLRDQLVSVYSPERVLGVRREEAHGVVVILRARARRIAMALDDVEDVIMVNFSEVKRPSPRDAADGVLLGIARHGDRLVGLIDVQALAAALAAAPVGERS